MLENMFTPKQMDVLRNEVKNPSMAKVHIEICTIADQSIHGQIESRQDLSLLKPQLGFAPRHIYVLEKEKRNFHFWSQVERAIANSPYLQKEFKNLEEQRDYFADIFTLGDYAKTLILKATSVFTTLQPGKVKYLKLKNSLPKKTKWVLPYSIDNYQPILVALVENGELVATGKMEEQIKDFQLIFKHNVLEDISFRLSDKGKKWLVSQKSIAKA